MEISSFEIGHDRVETPFSPRVLGCHRPNPASLLSFSIRLTVRVNFTRDRGEVPPLLVGEPRGASNVLAYFFRRNISFLFRLEKALKPTVVLRIVPQGRVVAGS